MEIWECLCLDLEVLPDFGYANYYPSFSAVSETWNNKVLEIMLQAFSFYRSENRVLLQTHCGPLLAGSSCLPVFMEGGQRRKEAGGGKRLWGQDRTRRSSLSSRPLLPRFPRQYFQAGRAGRGAGKARREGGPAGPRQTPVTRAIYFLGAD